MNLSVAVVWWDLCGHDDFGAENRWTVLEAHMAKEDAGRIYKALGAEEFCRGRSA